MDTQETGTEPTEETTATSDTVTEEDAELRRIADKKKYLSDLDREIKEKEALRKKASEPEDDEDMITWHSVNSDDLKLVNKEYKEELQFYKTNKIPVTNDIRDRALRDAKYRKGVRPEETERQATNTSVQGEMRKSTKTTGVPDTVKNVVSKDYTPEKHAKYEAEFRARGLKV